MTEGNAPKQGAAQRCAAPCHRSVLVPPQPSVCLMTEDEARDLLGQRRHVKAGLPLPDLTGPALLASGGLLVQGRPPLLPVPWTTPAPSRRDIR
jgi:hypothetical protein